ncbi:MAG: TonB family protein [Allosphingosinicella sp.]
MMEGAFYQQKTGNPKALAAVILMHGAALTALAMAKSEVFSPPRVPPIDVTFIKDPPPPPPNEPQPTQPASQPNTVITHVPPIIDMPPRPVFTSTEPLPDVREITIARPDPTPVLKADPAPLPVARTVEPARAKANLASYVSDEDYPSNAVRNEEQGTTRFRLAVGPDGRVKECSVTGSSGSSALDSTTCKLMRQRARFTPARNNRNEPTGDTVASAIRWVLPSD